MQDIMEFARINMMWTIGWVVLLAVIIYMTIKQNLSKVKEIGRTQATNLINQQNAVVVDVRPHDAYRSGHIVDSINITSSEITNNNLGSLEKHKTQPVIVVCANGMAPSRDAASTLTKLGFTQVYMLKDGIAGWNGDNLPLVRQKGK
jgi:rhodanese-related sulfurtransferase